MTLKQDAWVTSIKRKIKQFKKRRLFNRRLNQYTSLDYLINFERSVPVEWKETLDHKVRAFLNKRDVVIRKK